MIVLVLAVFTVIFGVAGAEFVRSTCRRQLLAPRRGAATPPVRRARAVPRLPG